MTEYKIKKDITKRPTERPDGIIFMHSLNLINKQVPITNRVLHSTDKPTFPIWQDYLLNKISIHNAEYYSKFKLPFHYYMEFLDDDYVAYLGLSQYKTSWFLEEMVNYGIIDSRYKNYLLVVSDTNFERDYVPQRLYDQLVQKILDPLMHQWQFDINDIKYYDEILLDDFDKKMENNPKFHWEYHPMLKFNFIRFKQSVDRIHWSYQIISGKKIR